MKRGGKIPVLRIELPMEGSPRVSIEADGLADELAIRAWLLSNPTALYALGGVARRALLFDYPDDVRRAA